MNVLINELFDVVYKPKYRFKSYRELLDTPGISILYHAYTSNILINIGGDVGYYINESVLEQALTHCNCLQHLNKHFLDTCCVKIEG